MYIFYKTENAFNGLEKKPIFSIKVPLKGFFNLKGLLNGNIEAGRFWYVL